MPRRHLSFLCFFALLLTGPVISAGGIENPSKPASVRPGMNPELPTIFIAGDSTAAKGKGEHQQGWAVPFADYFDPGKVRVDNRARGGRSSRTFITEGLWNELLDDLHAGDVVIIQFGHNDASDINDKYRARGTIKGFGEETIGIDNAVTGERETVHSYGRYLRKYMADAKAAGAHPIVCSPVPRKMWDNRKIVRGTDSYGDWAEAVAKQAGIAFVDLEELAASSYNQLGPAAVDLLFGDAHTHTNAAGAVLNAGCFVQGLRKLREHPLKDLLLNP